MRQQHRRTNHFKTRPACEGLEPRSLMSVAGTTLHSGQTTAAVHALSNHSGFHSGSPLLPQLPTTPQVMASTTNSSNGDLNPYGVAVIPNGFTKKSPLKPGDILVSNFNGPANLQGTGTSIVSVAPDGSTTLFARTASDTGLSTALGVLSNRFIVVGNLPSTNGTAATASPGSLLILNAAGTVVKEISNPALIDGPWDLTITQNGSHASIFVSNAENGTITRINLTVPTSGRNIVVTSTTEIASGYPNRSDPYSFFIAPTGLAFNAKSDTLYVASTLNSAIYAVKNAAKTKVDHGTGQVVTADQTHLHGPLGLAFAPNGDLIAANGDSVNPDTNQPSELVEFTTKGKFVAQLSINTGIGAPFGLAITSTNNGARLAAVDDLLNQLDIFSVGMS
jgi:hypothetical protein